MTSTKDLKRSDQHWSVERFHDHFEALTSLEERLASLIEVFKPEEIEWPAPSDLQVIEMPLYVNENKIYSPTVTVTAPSEKKPND